MISPRRVRDTEGAGDRGLLIIGTVIVALLGCAAAFAIWNVRQQALYEHRREATNLALVLGEQTARYVQTIDRAITEAISWATPLDLRTTETFSSAMRSTKIRGRLVARRDNLFAAPAIDILAADGELLNSSQPDFAPGVNLADLDFFRNLKARDSSGNFISLPSVHHVTGKPSLFCARRVTANDGVLAGYVVGVFDIGYLSDFYRRITERFAGTVTLLNRDGTVLLRTPDAEAATGQKVPPGSIWYSRVAEGGGQYSEAGDSWNVAGLVLVSPLQAYPVVVDVRIPDAVILASWRRAAIYILTGGLLVLLGFMVLTLVIASQLRRQRQQNAALNEASVALGASEWKSRLSAEMSADWFWEQGADLRFSHDAMIPHSPFSIDAGKTRWDFGDPAMDQHRWDAHKADLAARRPFRDFRWERLRTGGQRRFMSTSGDPVFDETGEFLGYHGTGRDITAEVESAAELRAAKERSEQAETLLRDAVDTLPEGFVIFDQDDRFILCNDTYREIHRRIYPDSTDCLIEGARLEDILRQTLAMEQAGAITLEHETEWLAERLRSYRRDEGSFEQRLNDGSWYLVTNRRMKNGGVAGLRVNITERKRTEDRVLHMARHDALTDLPNRAFMSDHLSGVLKLAADNDEALAVLALDLDRFKAINDGFGHAVGDGLLILVAARLKAAMSASDTLARVGGDEFVVLQTGADATAAVELAQRLIEALSRPFELNDIQMRIGTSIGIALYPAHGEDAGSLLKNADTALYRAKSDRLSGFCFFEASMDLRQRERWELERDLRLAIGTDQLRLHYQPIFTSTTRSIIGFEALLRWRHPLRGDIPPMSFIQIAEETGMVLPIGAWVLEEACRTAAAWPKPRRIAVNLSAAQLRSGELPAQVADILRRTGLAPGLLELEVTETMLISDHGQALDTLHEVRNMGVQIACDDFGTGYSSFSYIQKLAFDRIKIDRSFVRELGVTPASLRIVQAILAMARSLGMEVTAEGVETEQQLSILRAQGCGELQGFLLARPMPAEAAHAMLSGIDSGGAPFLEQNRPPVPSTVRIGQFASRSVDRTRTRLVPEDSV